MHKYIHTIYKSTLYGLNVYRLLLHGTVTEHVFMNNRLQFSVTPVD